MKKILLFVVLVALFFCGVHAQKEQKCGASPCVSKSQVRQSKRVKQCGDSCEPCDSAGPQTKQLMQGQEGVQQMRKEDVSNQKIEKGQKKHMRKKKNKQIE